MAAGHIHIPDLRRISITPVDLLPPELRLCQSKALLYAFVMLTLIRSGLVMTTICAQPKRHPIHDAFVSAAMARF